MMNTVKTELMYTRGIIPQINVKEEAFIFVYGTLLKGRKNYNAFLAPEEPVMRGEIEGFVMYEVGGFPGIVEGKGKVKGEVYRVTSRQMKEIDRLEGEGRLYIKKRVTVHGYRNEEVQAYVYVYNYDVKNLELIPYEAQPYKNEYVWYVAYGSNMCFERFASYIEGGYCERNGRDYIPCEDTTLPTESVGIEICGNMYFANFNEGAWENSAVSFLDLDGLGIALCRAYLIKETQLEHIHKQEGRGANWYPDMVELDNIQGIRAVTFTNKVVKEYSPMSEISAAYISTILDGITELGESMDYAFYYIKECTSPYVDCAWYRGHSKHISRTIENGFYKKYKAVKKHIDEYDLEGFFPMAPQSEYDGESRRISEKITLSSTIEDIADIISDEFAFYLSHDPNDERFLEIAKEIRKDLDKI